MLSRTNAANQVPGANFFGEGVAHDRSSVFSNGVGWRLNLPFSAPL
jgi:hypothetical protein